MGLDFVALDFETANRSHASACAVGAVRVRDGQVVDEYATLVRPAEELDDFEPGNVRVHRITFDDVKSAPGWPEVYGHLRTFIGDDVVVGHNAAFDMSVLLNTCGAHDIEFPALSSLCTLQLARASIKIPSYSLPWVVEHLQLPAFDHHDPLADARASALVLIALAARAGVHSVADLSDYLRVPRIPTWTERDDMLFAQLSAESDDLIGTGFAGEVVCFTGALKMMVRDRARELVVEQGGKWQEGVTKTTSILVTGDFDERTFRPGAAFSSKLAKAFAQVDAGQKLEIITEEAFITRMTIGEQELRARLGARNARTKVPDWVVSQAGNGPGEDFWDWYRRALAHPSGRASGGEPCIWCNAPVPAKTHWIHRDRHVCGAYCNERLKRGARRAWHREGIAVHVAEWE
ncbi:exonuclease domain-containing protein [Microbacterium sp. SORGH_AS_0862]|uniref:exonuclease domain-containing protein n=1 Tax=Microbacterium sp. SORGH_AS_0862 TaxID=3041789 RepID=UPI00278F323A|nr:exonuclease domain-containing protein [Microbacterium sp. SORGH_AS_0862]MDQ1205199.1 DNA polymerase-3 subunit epsilon [Microbacterium sp. SORGH_AS_0862]